MGEESTASLRGVRVLVVDDEPAVLRSISRMLERVEFSCDIAGNIEETFARLGTQHYDVLLCDVGLGAESGEDVLVRALTLSDAPQVLMMSGAASIDRAVRAMRLGAADFLEKPIHQAYLLSRIQSLVDTARQRRQVNVAATTPTAGSNPLGEVQLSPAMARAMALAERVANTPSSPALLLGESGVGKEVLASFIHRKSQRHTEPFVRVNVAAIPESMIEAELFGSMKGAFTDSKQSRVGHIASADHGTLLMDEIGELRVEYQPKLLRVLEDRRFFPIGSDRERVVDVRFLAATNREPEEMIAKGLLRRDLFYRLGLVIRIPPLRERVEEIIPLARQFIAHFCAEFGRPPMHLTPSAEQSLLLHRWPGNIRELRNVIERAVMISFADEISAEALDLVSAAAACGVMASVVASRPPPSMPMEALPAAARAATSQLERQRIIDVLKLVGGSRSRAAIVLGVSRSTLYEKLKRYGIE